MSVTVYTLVGAIVDTFAAAALEAVGAVDGGRPIVAAIGLFLADLYAGVAGALSVAVGTLVGAGVDAFSVAALEAVGALNCRGPIQTARRLLLTGSYAGVAGALGITLGALVGALVDAFAAAALQLIGAGDGGRPVVAPIGLFFADLKAVAAVALNAVFCTLIGTDNNALPIAAFVIGGAGDRRGPVVAAVDLFLTDLKIARSVALSITVRAMVGTVVDAFAGAAR